jgi:hypothetical protein
MLDVDVNAISHGSDAGCGNRVAKMGHQETGLFNVFHILGARALLLRELPRITGDATSLQKWIEQAQRPQNSARRRPNSKQILEAESYVSTKFWRSAVCSLLATEAKFQMEWLSVFDFIRPISYQDQIPKPDRFEQ